VLSDSFENILEVLWFIGVFDKLIILYQFVTFYFVSITVD